MGFRIVDQQFTRKTYNLIHPTFPVSKRFFVLQNPNLEDLRVCFLLTNKQGH